MTDIPEVLNTKTLILYLTSSLEAYNFYFITDSALLEVTVLRHPCT